MGSACVKRSGKPEKPSEVTDIQEDGGHVEATENGKQEEQIVNGECATYVQLALDKEVITPDEVENYSRYLCDIPGEELTFNFDNVVIHDENLDTTDTGGRNKLMSAFNSQSNLLAGKGPELSSESLENLDIVERKTTWKLKRHEEFDYHTPTESYSAVSEHTIDILDEQRQRLIYALSDLHLGGTWSEGMEEKLENYMQYLVGKAEEIAAVVFLGDIFEMWMEKFHEVPIENRDRVNLWKNSSPRLIETVHKLINEHNVTVFYVRGNHDHEITAEDVKDIFGDKVIFIPCTLILRLRISEQHEQRVRLAHGHEWDVFNSYMLHKTDHLLPNRPIGYYIARAVATAGGNDKSSELEDLLITLSHNLLTMMPSYLEDDLVDVLVTPAYQRKLLVRLFEGAFKVNDIDILINAKCRVSAQSYIALKTMLEYPLFRLSASMVGKRDVFHMIKAATGNYKKFIKRLDEDVVVLAHTHRWDLKRYRNYKGNSVIYANTGCWTNNCSEFSTVVLNPPTTLDDGTVTIDYGKNK